MKLIKAIEERWSPRSYDSRPVNEEQQEDVLQQARELQDLSATTASSERSTDTSSDV